MLRYDRQTKTGLVALYDIRPGNGEVRILTTPEPARGFTTKMDIEETCSNLYNQAQKLCTVAYVNRNVCVPTAFCYLLGVYTVYWSDRPVGRSLGRADQSVRGSERVNASSDWSDRPVGPTGRSDDRTV